MKNFLYFHLALAGLLAVLFAAAQCSVEPAAAHDAPTICLFVPAPAF